MGTSLGRLWNERIHHEFVLDRDPKQTREEGREGRSTRKSQTPEPEPGRSCRTPVGPGEYQQLWITCFQVIFSTGDLRLYLKNNRS